MFCSCARCSWEHCFLDSVSPCTDSVSDSVVHLHCLVDGSLNSVIFFTQQYFVQIIGLSYYKA
jgi:hypothetical protein